jgi:hypothetical protein
VASGKRFRSWASWRVPASALVFLVIPILFLIAVFELTKAKGPQWMPDSFENPYAYLFNSLLVVKGRQPVYTDHPGTTTEVFGGIVLRASSLKSTDELIASTLQNPEKQIRKLHQALLFFTALVLWLGPWLTAISLRNFVVGLLIQAPSLFYQTLLWYGFFFGSDLMLVPFSIAAICGCTLLVAPKPVPEIHEILFGIRRRSIAHRSLHLVRIPILAAFTGVVCALGIATKLTFFPLILISLICCRDRKNLLTFVAAFVVGVVVALLPIRSQLARLLTFAFSLGIHSGYYGHGAVGLPQASVYFQSIWDLLQGEPLLAIIPSVTIIAVIVPSFFGKEKKTSPGTISWRTVLLLFGAQLVSFLAIAKHPDLHYLIPLFLTTGFSLVLLFYTFQGPSSSAIRRFIGWIALASLLLLGVKDFVVKAPAAYVRLAEQRVDQLRLYKRAKEVTKDGVLVEYLFSDTPLFPICFGDDFAGRAFGSLLNKLYPNELFFDVVNGKFETFTGSLEPAVVLRKYDHLYFLGTPSFFPKIDGLDPQTFETIDHSGEDYYLQKWTRH